MIVIGGTVLTGGQGHHHRHDRRRAAAAGHAQRHRDGRRAEALAYNIFIGGIILGMMALHSLHGSSDSEAEA